MEQIEGLQVEPVRGMPLFGPGMSIAAELATALDRSNKALADTDVCIVAQKIVSKAERRIVRLAEVVPGEEAARLSMQTGRSPQLVQLIIDESSEILRATPAAIIARHRSGHVLANAGIDASNVEGGDGESVLLWPADPDASARAIRAELRRLIGRSPALMIADSLGRAWRIGTVGAAIGCAGLAVLQDRRGERDLFGRELQATVIGVADTIAAMAALVMGEGDEGTPAAVVRGAGRWILHDRDGPGAAAGLRPIAQDLFR